MRCHECYTLDSSECLGLSLDYLQNSPDLCSRQVSTCFKACSLRVGLPNKRSHLLLSFQKFLGSSHTFTLLDEIQTQLLKDRAINNVNNTINK